MCSGARVSQRSGKGIAVVLGLLPQDPFLVLPLQAVSLASLPLGFLFDSANGKTEGWEEGISQVHCLCKKLPQTCDVNNTSLVSYNSGGQKSEISLPGLKSRNWQGCLPSGSSRGDPVSFPFPVSRGWRLGWGHVGEPLCFGQWCEH